ncbi:TonB-dependent receptor [Sphingomonas aurantiaca]|uniref:TonB-dependent receptor domain-containing protein n=1 Tax=Sphingomonas aurantiaca TaxID=185949 RepID=UPI002FE02A22
MEYRVNDSKDRERAAKLDVTRDLTGVVSALHAGVKYQKRTRAYDRRDINFTSGITGKYFDASYFVPFPVDDFLDGAKGDLPTSWAIPDPAKFLAAATGKEALLAAPLARGDLRNSYAIGEEIVAGYGMADFAFPLGGVAVRGDIGVRYARTRQTSSGYADDGKVALPVTYDKTYDNFLPSLNLVAEVSPDLQMRFAASKVITRPSLADLAPRLTINSSPTVLTAVGGNPELKPFEAWQYDATAEWYFAPEQRAGRRRILQGHHDLRVPADARLRPRRPDLSPDRAQERRRRLCRRDRDRLSAAVQDAACTVRRPWRAGQLHAHQDRRHLCAGDRRHVPRCAGRCRQGQLQPDRLLREGPHRRARQLQPGAATCCATSAAPGSPRTTTARSAASTSTCRTR